MPAAGIGQWLSESGGINVSEKTKSNNKAGYFEYLRGRSLSGLIYRNYWLYPRLAGHLSGRVLDVGCGIGDFLAYRKGTVGVDVNPQTVAWCQQRGLDARIMDLDILPFPDASFDAVVFDNVLEHLVSPLPLLTEIHRVLVPGGRFMVGVPGKRGFVCDPDHKIFYDEPGLVAVMAQAAFNKQDLFYMPLKSDWLAERLSQYCLYGVFFRY